MKIEKMNYAIKLIKTSIYSGILGLLIVSTSYATVPHSIQALEHAVDALYI